MADRREAEAAAARAEAETAGGASGAGGAGGAGRARRQVLRGDRSPKRNVALKVGVGLVGLLTLATAALTRQPRPPQLEPDCDRAAFALASPAKQARPLAFTVVGPSDRRYALALNAATFRRQGTEWVPEPVAGRSRADVVVARLDSLPGCARSGVLNLPVPLGAHPVALFELRDSGAAEVQRETIEVVDADDEDLIEAPR